jgi:hypothetical protein
MNYFIARLFNNYAISIADINRRGRVVSTPASYLEVLTSNLGPDTGYFN